MMMDILVFNFEALGGPNEIQVYHKDHSEAEKIVQKVIEAVKKIEVKYSRYNAVSIVSKINSNAGLDPVEVDSDTAAILDYADACYKQSKGLFDITSGVLRKAWDFKAARVPSQETLDDILPLIGWDKVKWQKPYFSLPKKGMEIDLGGIGKEYAVDLAAGILLSEKIQNCLINFAGDIRVLGPQANEKAWNIGIQNPRKSSEALTSIGIKKGAVTTSGDYERFFEADGKRYCHILNPKTGWPCEGFQSVTVIADSCLVAGSISTISMLLGEKKGLDFLQSSGLQYLAVSQSGFLHKRMI